MGGSVECVWAAERGRPAWRALCLVFVITTATVKHISRHADDDPSGLVAPQGGTHLVKQ